MQQQMQRVSTQIPEDIARFAHEQQLGAPQGSYDVLKLPRGWRWFTFAIWLVLSGDSIAIGAALILFFFFRDTVSENVLFQFTLLPLILSHAFFLILRMILTTNQIYTCDNGLVLKQSTKKFRVIRWNEIKNIQSMFTYVPGSFFAKHHVYTMRCHDGYILTFSGSRKKLSGLDKAWEDQIGHSEPEADFESLAPYDTTATIVSNGRNIDSLPEELAALAEEHGLGERRVDQTFGLRHMPIWILVIGFLILEFFFTGILFSIFHVLSSESPYEPAWIQIFYLVLQYFLFASAILYVLITCLPALWHLPHTTYTFERGLIFRNGQQAPVICRWDEIKSIQRASTFGKYMVHQAGVSNAYTFQLRDGTKLFLSAFDVNYQDLTSLIKEQIVPVQLPTAVATYQNDQTLSFGQLRVNQQGIALGKQQLPWSQVKSVGLEARHLVIYDISQRKPWCRLLATRIPNLFLLFALADYARDIATH